MIPEEAPPEEVVEEVAEPVAANPEPVAANPEPVEVSSIVPYEELLPPNPNISEELEKVVASNAYNRFQYFLKHPDEIPNALAPEEVVLIRMVMASLCGTGAQRGSITRILKTLREEFPPASVYLSKIQ